MPEVQIVVAEQQRAATPWSHDEVVDSIDFERTRAHLVHGATTPEALADLLDDWLSDFQVAEMLAGDRPLKGRPHRVSYWARCGGVASAPRTWADGVELVQS